MLSRYCALKAGDLVIFDNQHIYTVVENIINYRIIFDTINKPYQCHHLFYDDIDNRDYFEIYEG